VTDLSECVYYDYYCWKRVVSLAQPCDTEINIARDISRYVTRSLHMHIGFYYY